MTLNELIKILTDPENQPHQYVDDPNGLKEDLMACEEIVDLRCDQDYAEFLEEQVRDIQLKMADVEYEISHRRKEYSYDTIKRLERNKK